MKEQRLYKNTLLLLIRTYLRKSELQQQTICQCARPGNQIGSTPLPMVAVGQKGLLLNNYKGSTRPKYIVKNGPQTQKMTFRPQ